LRKKKGNQKSIKKKTERQRLHYEHPPRSNRNTDKNEKVSSLYAVPLQSKDDEGKGREKKSYERSHVC
jgi:hypothetical protein